MSNSFELYNNKLKEFFDFCYKTVSNITISKRTRKIFFTDILYILCCNISNHQGFTLSLSDIKTDKFFTSQKLFNFTKSAIIQKRSGICYVHFEQLNNALLNYIYKDTQSRLIAVDGTFIYGDLHHSKNNIPVSNNNNCTKWLVNVLFDVEKCIPIDYGHNIHKNERVAFVDQLSYFRKGDILIFDRGYYGAELIHAITTNKVTINGIFRVQTNMFNDEFQKILTKSGETISTIIYDGKTIPVRLIKYYINNGKGDMLYHLCTTLMDSDKYSIEYFKEAYHKRWDVEIHIRHSKYDAFLGAVKAHSVNNVKQDILVNQFLFILSSYIEHLIKPYKKLPKKSGYVTKLNTKNCFNLTSNKLLKLILYNKHNVNDVNVVIKEILHTTQYIKINRTYPRVRKRPRQKWGTNGPISTHPIKDKKSKKTQILTKHKKDPDKI